MTDNLDPKNLANMDELEANPQNHERFLNILRGRVSPKKLELIDQAYNLAKYGHRNQFRDNGERYFEHCRQTALILIEELGITRYKLVIAALLHDVIEDSYVVNRRTIKKLFGKKVARLVRTVTKPKKDDPRFSSDEERHDFYHQQIRNAEVDAMMIKFLDNLNNMRTRFDCTDEKQERKSTESIVHYVPLIPCVTAVYPIQGQYLQREFAKTLNSTSPPKP